MSLSTVQSIVPAGNSSYIAGTTTSQATVVTSTNGSLVNIYVENLDTTNDVFVTWNTNAQAVTTAVAPTLGNPQTGIAVQNGQGRSILIAQPGSGLVSANVAVVAFSGTANVTITPVA